MWQVLLVPIAHTTQLVVSHRGYATAVLAPFCLGATQGQNPPSCALQMGTACWPPCSALAAQLLPCRKTRSSTTCADSSAEELGPEGKETCCPSCARKVCSSGHHSRDVLWGLLAIVHSVPTGSLRIHHTGHLEELICSVQSYEPILPKQEGFMVTTGCFRCLPGQGPPSTAALRLSQELGLIFSHFNRLCGVKGTWGCKFMVIQHWHFQGSWTAKLQVQHLMEVPQMHPCIWVSSGAIHLSAPPFELTCRDRGCRQAQSYSPPQRGSAQKAPSWSGRCLSLRRALTRCLGLCPCSESHWWCWVWSLIRGSLLPSGNLEKRCVTEMSQTCEQGHPWALQAPARFLIPPLPWAAAFPTC